ncbi:MAG: hypothetical protein IKW98_08095 [Prevotella sp.]|nr:hypothetical protein [Prevotella sp.]
MTTKSLLVKSMFMNILTASLFTVAMTACNDEVEMDQATATEQDFDCRTRAIVDGKGLRYNINEDLGVCNPTFNHENWRQHNAIYMCYSDASEIDETIKDSEGRKGYRLEILPWGKDEGGSLSCASNLPNKFCDDITPENGWELVANFCGDFHNPNANYFVLYNKYMGKLRYFYFIPRNAQNSQANDHNWEIQMQDGVAEHSVFGYAAPMDVKMTNPKAIDAELGGYWTQFVTPWTSTANSLGQQKVKEGWYAFDVDLSVYRGENNRIKSSDMMKTSICGYTTSNVDLFGKLNADITGDIKLEKCCVNTTSGVFGPLEDVLGQVKGIKDFIGGAKEVYSNLMSGDILGAIEGGINVAKQGCDLVGIDYGAEKTGFDGYKGDVNLKLNGTINMAGRINTEFNINGISNTVQAMNYFDFANSTVGQGVWNLETSPVVYHTNATVLWDQKYIACNTLIRFKKQSPFGGNAGDEYAKPCRGSVCYFDPSSIKLALNPNVFTPEEIASAKVYAVCGVRKDAKFGSTEAYRAALGLNKSQFNNSYIEYANRPLFEAPFDAYSSQKNDMGMKIGAKFNAETYNGHQYGVFGRGDADYLVEPQALGGYNDPNMLPAYEVTVTVMVEHNGKPIVYSRTYLPEYKEMPIEQMPQITDSYIEQNLPANYVPELYAQQMAHVKDIRDWTRRTLIPTGGTPCHMEAKRKCTKGADTWYVDDNECYVSEKESYAALFDNDLSNRWVAAWDNVYFVYDRWLTDDDIFCSGRAVCDGVWKNQPCWWVEFKSNLPISPRSYTLISANDAGKYPQCNPQCWILYGKKKESDPWTMLGMSSYNNQPEDMLPKANSQPTHELPFRFNKCEDMQYFRFEIQNTDKTNHLQRLGEIRFNYDD